LNDPKKRRKYDRGGMEAVNEQHQEHDPFDVFGMFGGGSRGQRKDEDLVVPLRTSLKDLYTGREFEVRIINIK
jgi:DnaJ-class molecular chaperone